jgi:DNA-binding transcriptional LysR family regulator
LAALRGKEAARPVVLGAGEGAFLYLLGPAIRDHVGHLRLVTADRASVLEGVASRELDVGVIAGPEGDEPPLPSRKLTRVGSMLVVPRGHALAARKRVGAEDLRGLALVVPPAARPHRIALERMLAERNVPWTVAVEASGWELAIHFAGLGLGVAVVNACCRLPRGVVGIPFTGLPTIEYRVVQARGAAVSDRTRTLITDLVHHANAWKASVP